MATCKCSTCGYEWQQGTNGDHSCSTVLRANYVKLSALAEEFHSEVMPQAGKLVFQDYTAVNELGIELQKARKFRHGLV